jgi:hypothetical protein
MGELRYSGRSRGEEMVRYPVPGHGVVVKSGRGEAHVWRASAKVLMCAGYGHLSMDMVDEYSKAIERLTRGASNVLIFSDALDVTSYQPEFRVQITECLKANRRRFCANHLLTRSRIVQLGASVVNLVLGHSMLRVHRTIESFEDALIAAGAEEVPRSRLHPERVAAG